MAYGTAIGKIHAFSRFVLRYIRVSTYKHPKRTDCTGGKEQISIKEILEQVDSYAGYSVECKGCGFGGHGNERDIHHIIIHMIVQLLPILVRDA